MNYKKNVLLFNIIFLLCLLVANYIFPVKVADKLGFRSISILADVQVDSTLDIEKNNETKANSPKVTKENNAVKDHITTNGLVNSAGDKHAISTFLKALSEQKKFKNKKVRIAYFGDSFIEGDLITHDLRALLQNEFGGDGVGFMPVTSISAGSRTSITQSFSKDWEDINFKSDKKATENLFLSGHTYYAGPASWVNFKGVKESHLDSFTNVQVLYGPSKLNETEFSIQINGKEQKLQPHQFFNSSLINLEKTKAVQISIKNSSIPLYGFVFESNTGIFVDNFSFRGISGVELDNFKMDFLQQIQKQHPYDLLIIHYGPNLLFNSKLVDFSWYQKKMDLVLRKIRSAFPQTSILLISTADKGAKYDGKWMTEKGVLPLIETQYDLALKNNMDFFNLYNGMGGNNSMVDWAEQTPSLSNKDYTHVNIRGAKRIAEIIYSSIIKEFNNYLKLD